MGQALFYHLTRRPLEDTLRTLLAKSLERGWRVVVRGVDEQRMTRLDQQLWLGAGSWVPSAWTVRRRPRQGPAGPSDHRQ